MKHKKGKILVGRVAFALLLSLVLMLSLAPPVMAEEGHLKNWEKSPETPVLDVSPGTWNDTGVGAACVITDTDGASYKMWYTGYNATQVFRIGYATSDNGTGWNKFGPAVLPPGVLDDWDAEGVGSPCVIKAGPNSYQMWYTGYKEIDGELIPQIGYATGNGTDWLKYGTAPVLPRGDLGEWDRKGAHSPWVIYENDTYKMWYTGRSGTPILGTSSIGYAWSDNGIDWNKFGAPVLPHGGAGAWDERGATTASVIEDGGNYYMWYTGYSGFGGGVAVSIGVAQSDNETNWSKNPKPVLAGEAAGWNPGGAGAPCVVKESDTQLTMWYSGVASGGGIRLGRATTTVNQMVVTVKLQGDARDEPELTVPFIIKLFDSGVGLTWMNIVTKVLHEATDNFTTTDWVNGAGGITLTDFVEASPGVPGVVTLAVENVLPGTYQLALTSPHNLINRRQGVMTTIAGASVDMELLLEGNANDSYMIDIDDFTILAGAFRATPADTGRWDAGADFDRSGKVTILDFGLLAANFNETSPVPVTG